MTNSAKYEILYFPFQGRAEPIRILLRFLGVAYTERVAVNNLLFTYPIPIPPTNHLRFVKSWPADKPTTPFGQLPVLTETLDDGTTITVAQSRTILRHLARVHGLDGETELEKTLCDQYNECWGTYPIIGSLAIALGIRNLHIVDTVDFETEFLKHIVRPFHEKRSESERAELKSTFFTTILPRFLETQDKHLKKNGDNGHYTTYTDLYAFFWVGRVLFEDATAITPSTAPALWKLYETHKEHPRIKAYQESSEHLPVYPRGV
ncbi:hypothetical protein HK104_005139 [Borealophlyctis nickersoniae]|nr:hypothetical protein HK104_005139 [Borealophlyctis nickersoniae]